MLGKSPIIKCERFNLRYIAQPFLQDLKLYNAELNKHFNFIRMQHSLRTAHRFLALDNNMALLDHFISSQ